MVDVPSLSIGIKLAQALGLDPGGGLQDSQNALNLYTGMKTGAAGRVLGAQELGANIAQEAGFDDQDYKDLLAQAEQQNTQDNSGTGVYGEVGKIAGDPMSYMGGSGIARNAMVAALQGASTPTQNNQSSLGQNALNSGVSTVFGLGGQALGSGINQLALGASDMVSPTAQEAVSQLNDVGVPVRLSQAMNSKPLAMVDKAISMVPFSGAGAAQEAQQGAFTQALSNTFGEDSPVINENVLASAKQRLGDQYDNILKDKVIPIDRPQFAQQLSGVTNDLGLQTDANGVDFLNKQANNILNTVDNNGGSLPGQAYQSLRQTLKGAQQTNYTAGGLKDFLDDTVRQNAPEDVTTALSNTDEQYRNMKIAEKLYGQQQNSTGVFRPETVYNAAKPSIGDLASGGGGQMGILARAGRQLKPTIPDSGTTAQLLGAGALLEAGRSALTHPIAGGIAGAGALGTIGLAKGINGLMTSKYAYNGLSPDIQSATQGLSDSGIIPAFARGVAPDIYNKLTNAHPSNTAPIAPNPYMLLGQQSNPYMNLGVQ